MAKQTSDQVIVSARFPGNELATLEAVEDIYRAWAEADDLKPPSRSEVIRACVRQQARLLAAVAENSGRQGLLNAAETAMLERGAPVRNDWSQGTRDVPAQ